jgi:hypothetical protein
MFHIPLLPEGTHADGVVSTFNNPVCIPFSIWASTSHLIVRSFSHPALSVLLPTLRSRITGEAVVPFQELRLAMTIFASLTQPFRSTTSQCVFSLISRLVQSHSPTLQSLQLAMIFFLYAFPFVFPILNSYAQSPMVQSAVTCNFANLSPTTASSIYFAHGSTSTLTRHVAMHLCCGDHMRLAACSSLLQLAYKSSHGDKRGIP